MRSEERILWAAIGAVVLWYLFIAGCIIAGIVLLYRIAG